MDIFSIQCFLAIVHSGSFTQASLAMNRTQSAITQQIRKLEKRLGVPLFDRKKKSTLTPEGEIFLSHARKIESAYVEMCNSFKKPNLSGEVRLGVPEDFATLFLAEVLVDFSKLYPRVSLSVECDLTLNLLRRFKSGALDLVIAKWHSADEKPEGVEMWSERLVWVGKERFLSDIQEKESLALVLSPEPCVYRRRVIEALKAASIKAHVVYTSPSYSGVIAAVTAEMGVTALPISMIPFHLEVIEEGKLPSLPDVHVSLMSQPLLLETEAAKEPLGILGHFLLKKLKENSQRAVSSTLRKRL